MVTTRTPMTALAPWTTPGGTRFPRVTHRVGGRVRIEHRTEAKRHRSPELLNRFARRPQLGDLPAQASSLVPTLGVVAEDRRNGQRSARIGPR